MRKFIITILSFFTIPLFALFGLYLWTDPFKTLHPFDVNDVDGTNREYQSMELFRKNYSTYNYNAFVFGSSKACGLNTYTWKMYLPDNTSQFLFQAWSESITGIKQKVEWLDKNNVSIDYALILIDIPSSFSPDNQEPNNALSAKHYLLCDEPEWVYHAKEYWNFIQNPKSWIDYTKRKIKNEKQPMGCDTISNDWNAYNKYNYKEVPNQDSLKNCSEQTRRSFFLNIKNASEKDIKMSDRLITEDIEQLLRDIKKCFDKHHTDYYIIVTPMYQYTNPYINSTDLAIIKEEFGSDRVYDFSHNSKYTSDYNNYSDPSHFGTILGYYMLKDIYEKTNK